MRMIPLVTVMLALAPCLAMSRQAQDKTQLQQNVERTLRANEPDFTCKKSIPEGEPAPGSPQVFYNFQCKYKDQKLNQVNGAIYVLNSKQDAVKMLERSQMYLQINESKPEYGIGEQAWGYAGQGAAWITFRNGNVFGQVNVGVIDPRTVVNPSPPPTRAELKAVLGSADALWSGIVRVVEERVSPLTTEWRPAKAEFGRMCLLQHKKRTLLYMTPEKQQVRVAIILGDRAYELAMASSLPAAIKKMFSEARPYAEGRGIRFSVHSSKDIPTIKTLVELKTTPK